MTHRMTLTQVVTHGWVHDTRMRDTLHSEPRM